ncbi:protein CHLORORESPIRATORY REDUCTION 42, chloroplastic [Henckelia pumila]|uniref:protein CHLORORESPIRATORY REDUCTION 42, chloroplastic n=1 Tax=Henckelia pumila TaxID=405737 RepID=UPI003C6E9987
MALNLSLMLTRASPNINHLKFHSLKRQFVTNCELNESKSSKLEIGSPIIVIEAPQLLKTAASVPCLRANSGLIKPGDVGRIVSRKPKDVWAVRLSVGTYLIDGKYFKPLELPE